MVNFSITSTGSPSGCHAFPKGSDITVTFTDTKALECQSVWFYIGNDECVLKSVNLPFAKLSTGVGFKTQYRFNTSELSPSDGLYFCHIEFVSEGVRYYTAFDAFGSCYIETKFVNETQILVYDEKYCTPDWLIGGAMYQIFPDRFSKGGKVKLRSDSALNPDWENGIPEFPLKAGDSFPNNTHFGGTLYGVADRLDYLSGLGVNCIYLNPIFEAFSCHKYDTADFMSVDNNFGGDEALQNLIDMAHERNIKVILDGVFNHVGNDSIYFDAYGKYGDGACSSEKSPYFGWFTFMEYPKVYESWWGITNLPKIVRCESYIKFITETVIPKYMEMGIDGWRLDVVDELEGDFLDRIVKSVKKYKSDAIIIGEVWEDASNKTAYDERKRYFRGTQLDSVTDYPLRNAVIEFVKYGNSELFVSTLLTLYRHYPPHKLACLMNFLGSHDTERITTVLGDESVLGLSNAEIAVKRMSAKNLKKAKELLKQAYLLIAAMPGVPCVYYGDEIAMEGYNDPFNRRPFPKKGFDDSFSGFFAEINGIRRNEPLFTAKELTACEETAGVARVVRKKDGSELIVLANMTNTPYEASVPKCVCLLTGAEYSKKIAVPAKTVVLLKTEV